MYGKKAGVNVPPHKHRNTLVARLLNQCIPIHSLQKLFGHEHRDTTLIYARIYDETIYRQLKEAMSHPEAIEVDALHNPERRKHNPVAVTLKGGINYLDISRRALTKSGQSELY